MTTDRELLEMAAKAAGLRIDKSTTNGGGMGNTGFSITGDAMLDWHNNVCWNPLKDDGDALRLAVKLQLKVVTPWTGGGYKACRADHIPTGREGPWVDGIADPYIATRRAIVLAAAEIGKAQS